MGICICSEVTPLRSVDVPVEAGDLAIVIDDFVGVVGHLRRVDPGALPWHFTERVYDLLSLRRRRVDGRGALLGVLAEIPLSLDFVRCHKSSLVAVAAIVATVLFTSGHHSAG